jgi:hypothetical protein
LHGNIQLERWGLVYSKGLQIDDGDVVPAEEASVIVINEITIAIPKDEEAVAFWPEASTEPGAAFDGFPRFDA